MTEYTSSAPAIVSAGGTIRITASDNYVPAIYERVYDYDAYVPLDYWGEDAILVPGGHANRIRQMDAFRQLYDGEYWRWGPYEVRLNYHEIVANFMADLLMAYPPEFEGVEDLSARFINTLLDSLYCVIVDLIRYGTGILHVLPTARGAEVVPRSPSQWFPASPDFGALVLPNESTIEVYISGSDGTHILETYDQPHNGKLGALLAVEDLSVGSLAEWDLIYETYTGRVGPIIPIARRPALHDFGRSLYPSITGLAFEAARGATENRDALREMLMPLVLWMPTDDGGVGDVDRPPSEREQLAYQSRMVWLERLRKNPSMELPEGIGDGKYLTYKPDIGASFKHNEETEKKLYIATSISPKLYGTVDYGPPISGVAFDRQFLREAIYARGFQTNLIDPALKALATAGVMLGKSALQAFLDALQIIWPLAFDRIESQDEVKVSGDEGVEVEEEAQDNVVPGE